MTAKGSSGGTARALDEHELLDDPTREDTGSIEMGTVGWSDRDEHFDLGTEDNDGHTLVLVTLFRGRDLTEPLTPAAGQGQQVVARMGKPARAVPSKGETVLVARPAGHDGVGAWHIIANPGPGTTFRNGPKPGDVLVEGNAGNFVRFGKDGAVSFATTLDGTSQSPTVQFQMRRDGFLMLGPWGKITYDASGFHLLHHTGARIDLGGIGGMPSPLDTLGAYASITAPIIKLAGSVVACGPDTGAPEPAAKAYQVITNFGAVGAFALAVSTAIGAIATALNGIAPGSGAGIAAPVGTALGTMTTAFSAAVATLPSSSTTVT